MTVTPILPSSDRGQLSCVRRFLAAHLSFCYFEATFSDFSLFMSVKTPNKYNQFSGTQKPVTPVTFRQMKNLCLKTPGSAAQFPSKQAHPVTKHFNQICMKCRLPLPRGQNQELLCARGKKRRENDERVDVGKLV